MNQFAKKRSERRVWSWVGVALTLVLLLGPGQVWATDTRLPFGMRVNHLNLVISATDADATVEFYGDALGLARRDDWNLPGGSIMLRFLAGDSELKFIVSSPKEGQTRQTFKGDASAARGIRLLALLLPGSQKEGVEQRFEKLGYDKVDYTHRPDGTVPYSYGMAYDRDGNQVEIVFLDEAAASPATFKQAQIGLTVSDAAAMNTFLTDVIGLEKTSAKKSPSSGAVIHRYAMGASQIKFWQGKEGLPAHTGRPEVLTGFSLVQFLVPDVDAVRTAVLERGGNIHTEPFPLGESAIMFVGGPDGILFEFAGPALARWSQSE